MAAYLCCDGLGDHAVDPGLIAAHVELEQLGIVGSGRRHLLEAGLAHRAQHVQRAERGRGPRRRQSAGRNDVLQRADRRQDHGQPHVVAEHLRTGARLLHVAQHARAEHDLVDGHAIALERRLGLAAAHQVVPGLVRDVGLRRAVELVQDLEGVLRHVSPPFLVAVGRVRRSAAACLDLELDRIPDQCGDVGSAESPSPGGCLSEK